jgi:histone H3/H4
MSKDKGVRNKPETTATNIMRYDVLGSKKRSDHLLYRIQRPIREYVVDPAKMMRLEVIKSKLKMIRKYKTDVMVINRFKIKKLVNSYGFYMSKDLPDAVNSIVERLVEEAIGRVYSLPSSQERITIKPTDLPLLFQ